MNAKGFTVVELLLTCTILIILVSIGIPSLSSQIQNSQLKTSTDEFINALNLTRTMAAAKNRRVTMRSTDDWAAGWEVFIDGNNNGLRDDGEEVVQSHEKLKGITAFSTSTVKHYVSYIGTGESRAANGNAGGGFLAGTIKLCNVKGKGVKLILAKGGRVRQTDIGPSDCN